MKKLWIMGILVLAIQACGTDDAYNSKSTKSPDANTTKENEQKSTKAVKSHSSDNPANSLAPVPIFQNELINKLVNRMHAIQIEKSENGDSDYLHKQEDAVLLELESMRSLLIGEEQMLLNQYLSVIGLHKGHKH